MTVVHPPEQDFRTQAAALIVHGRYREALTILAQAQAGRILDPDLLPMLGAAYQGLQLWKDSLAAFDRALELRPGQASVLALRARTLGRLGRGREALRDAEAAASLAPNDPEVIEILASAQMDAGRFDAVKATVAHLLEVSDRHSDAHRASAAIAMRQRDWRTAESELRTVVNRAGRCRRLDFDRESDFILTTA
jgi:Flp pilus assembly protein TadD